MIKHAAPCVERIRITGTPAMHGMGQHNTAHPAIRGIGQAFNSLRHTPDGNTGTVRRGAGLCCEAPVIPLPERVSGKQKAADYSVA